MYASKRKPATRPRTEIIEEIALTMDASALTSEKNIASASLLPMATLLRSARTKRKWQRDQFQFYPNRESSISSEKRVDCIIIDPIHELFIQPCLFLINKHTNREVDKNKLH